MWSPLLFNWGQWEHVHWCLWEVVSIFNYACLFTVQIMILNKSIKIDFGMYFAAWKNGRWTWAREQTKSSISLRNPTWWSKLEYISMGLKKKNQFFALLCIREFLICCCVLEHSENCHYFLKPMGLIGILVLFLNKLFSWVSCSLGFYSSPSISEGRVKNNLSLSLTWIKILCFG